MCVPKTVTKEVGDLIPESNGFIDRQRENRHLNWVPLRFGEANNRAVRREPPVAELADNFQVLTFVDDIIIVRREI